MSFSIDEITAQLHGVRPAEPGSAPPPLPPWLSASWKDPRGFFQALCEHAAERSEPRLKSRYGEGYDLYYDLIERNARLAPERAALRYVDSEQALQTLTFGELHRQAGQLAGELRARKVEPEAVVAIVAPCGPVLCVALAAVLCLGATACVIAPSGRAHVQNRLRGLKATLVVTIRDAQPLCVGSKPPPLVLPLPEGTGAQPAEPWERSHTYAPKDEALRVLSPLREPPDRALPLGGEAAYCHALRDGWLLFGLRPGDVLCAPGVLMHQHLPALLLAAWACGGCYLHCTVRDVSEARVLDRCPPRALIVTAELREALKQGPPLVPLKNLAIWLRNPEEPLEFFGWQEFIRAQNLAAVAHSNLVLDAAAGGALLFSARRPNVIHPEVWPAPGCEYLLLQPGTKEQAALGFGAVLQAKPPGDKAHPGHMVLVRARGGFLYGGTFTPRRSGRAYPSSEVCAALDGLPQLVGTAVVPLPPAAGGEPASFALVLFTGGPVPSGLTEAVLARVRVQLGEDALPDRVLPFPLLPRRDAKTKQVDTAWVQDQLVRGVLAQKAGEPAFLILTALRRALRADRRPEAEPGEPGAK